MKPIDFEGSNKNLVKPVGVTDEECGSLPVYCDGKTCLSQWQLDEHELAEIVKTKRIWLSVWSGQTQPPVGLAVVESADPTKCTKVRIGDEGQDFEVRARDKDTGIEFVVGWTNQADGGSLLRGAKKHPQWTDVRLVSRVDRIHSDGKLG